METPAAALLALEGVSRHLAGRPVVTGLDLAVTQGEVLGLLGINGAGKTTTLRMMAGELRPSTGVIRIDGTDLAEEPDHARRRIGYLPETPPLYPELTVSEFLGFCARLHGVADHLADNDEHALTLVRDIVSHLGAPRDAGDGCQSLPRWLRSSARSCGIGAAARCARMLPAAST